MDVYVVITCSGQLLACFDNLYDARVCATERHLTNLSYAYEECIEKVTMNLGSEDPKEIDFYYIPVDELPDHVQARCIARRKGYDEELEAQTQRRIAQKMATEEERRADAAAQAKVIETFRSQRLTELSSTDPEVRKRAEEDVHRLYLSMLPSDLRG